MKRLPALLCICGVCVGLLLYNLFGYQPKPAVDKSDAVPTTGQLAQNDSQVTEPYTPKEPRVQVRVLNEDPQRQQAWEQIAKQYSDSTGVEVVILEGSAENATLLTTDSLERLDAQDLSGTAAYAQLADMNLTLMENGKVCGIAAELNAFGLMYNTDLLIAAGYTPGDIFDLNSFSTVVQGLSQQGYTAFSGRGLTDGVAAKLAALPGSIRTLAQLWVTNTAEGSQEAALERFINGKTVFYLGSVEEYDTITAGGVNNLGILPIYLDDQPPQTQSLCVTAKQYWCVVGETEAEIAATMAFLDYLVMPDKNGVVPVDTLQILAPYRQATWFANPLEGVLRQDLTAGKGYLVCREVEQLPEGFVDALSAYAKDPTDENWNRVEAIKNQK